MARILKKTGDVPSRSLWNKIKDVALMDVAVLARGGVKSGSLERLEELLLDADFGVPTTLKLVAGVEQLAARGLVTSEDDFLGALRAGIVAALREGKSDTALRLAAEGPTVVLVVGINGAGKTTFVGKLANQLRREGKTVLLGAADTFRAGAIDQLRIWAERSRAEFVGGAPGSDPAAVAFDAIEAGLTRNVDYIIVDTAGRLHTSASLMDELKKVVRVTRKRIADAPHETLLVLDGTIGQNAVTQAKVFAEAVPLTGIVVTKVDGTARGGVAIAVHEAIDVPVKFLGVGEGVDDIETFDPEAFAREVLEE